MYQYSYCVKSMGNEPVFNRLGIITTDSLYYEAYYKKMEKEKKWIIKPFGKMYVIASNGDYHLWNIEINK